MKKVILDFYDVIEEMIPEKHSGSDRETDVVLADTPENRLCGYKELVYDYIAGKMDLPKCSGKNLDSLYDLLTGVSEPTAVGFFIPTVDFDDLSIDLMLYLDKVKKIFEEAEEDNPENLAVIYAESASAMPADCDPDEELGELMHDFLSGKL